MTFNLPLILFSIAAGAGAGIFYFGGLWLTVRRIPDSGHPGLLTLASFLVRVAVTVSVFYLIGGGHWPRLLAALSGLLLARHFIVRHLGPDKSSLAHKGVRP